MPMYEYLCERSHVTEQLRALEDRSKPCACKVCGLEAKRVASRCSFALGWVPIVCDSAKDVWQGTPLDGTDGINEMHYKSKDHRVFMDYGDE